MASNKTKKRKHDGMFKRTFSDLESARKLLKEFLPKKLLKIIDLTTLDSGSETFVEQSLQRNISDILYSIKMKDDEDGYLYLIVEHQSSVSYDLVDRVWKYTHLICEKHKDEKGKYPLILPIIIYNGQTKYTAPRSFFEKFRKPEIALEFFSNPWPLVNLTEMNKDEINYNLDISIPIHFMKYIHEEDKISVLHNLFKGKGETAVLQDKKNDYKHLKNMLYYFIDDNIPEDEQHLLRETLIDLLPDNDGEEIMITIADSYRQEGMKKGIEKGIEKGRKEGETKKATEVIANMLNDDFDIHTISKITGYSVDDVLEIRDQLQTKALPTVLDKA